MFLAKKKKIEVKYKPNHWNITVNKNKGVHRIFAERDLFNHKKKFIYPLGTD